MVGDVLVHTGTATPFWKTVIADGEVPFTAEASSVNTSVKGADVEAVGALICTYWLSVV